MRLLLSILCFVLFNSPFQIFAAPSERSDTLDIRKTKIEFTITDFTTKNIFAKTTLDIQSKMNNINELNFDLEGLVVDSAKIDGSLVTFSHTASLLNITALNILNINDTASVEIFYHGIPITDATWGGFSFVGNYGFQMGVGFNAQPHSFGRTWHPCFDNFVERSSYEFYITTTDDKIAVCNGLLIDSINNGNGTKTWHWNLDEKIPSYLASVAVCNYVFVKKVLNGNVGNVDALIACIPSDSNKVNGSFAHLQESFSMLESNFGTYQWSKVGYTLVPFNAGAMEHATNIHIGTPFVDGTLNYETLIAHELSHHWWGDLVTCSTAGDMWLNEGFASYCELLHQEFTYGKDAYIKDMKANHYNVLNTAHINDNGYRAVSNMDSLHTYGTTVYSKGEDMIHTMRTYLGDSLFFNGLTAFLNTYKWKSISTTDLRDFLTTYSGQDMTDFFKNWIQAPGFTHFSIDSSSFVQSGSNFDTKVFLRQRKHKSVDYYSNVPLELGFYDAQMNLHIYPLIFNGRCLEFDVQLPFEPALIVVDPNSKLSDAITEEEKVITSLGNTTFNQAKCRIYVKGIVTAGDSTFIRVEHSWIAPDRFQNQASANGYVLNDARYWKVDLINGDNIKGLMQFSYDGTSNSGYIDSTWIKNSEDSIRMFYRNDAREEWQLADDSLKIGAVNDKIGNIYIKEIKKGEYCFGIKRSGFIDTLTTDAPSGGCGIVTSTNKIKELNSSKIIVYPNPAKDEISIRFAESRYRNLKIKLISLQGIKLIDKKISGESQVVKIQLPAMAKGCYLLLVQDETSEIHYSEKIIIE